MANRNPYTTGGGGDGGDGVGGPTSHLVGYDAYAVKSLIGQVGGVPTRHALREHWSPPPKLIAVQPFVALHSEKVVNLLLLDQNEEKTCDAMTSCVAEQDETAA